MNLTHAHTLYAETEEKFMELWNGLMIEHINKTVKFEMSL